MKNKFYITTPIYYVNAKPHIGHAYTTIAADVLARFQKLQGKEVFFLTGTDEHGLKIQKKAAEAGMAPQQFVDGISEEFKRLWEGLDIGYSSFIRTTDEDHVETVKKVLQALYDRKAVKKGLYSGLYCVGCELFKSNNELVDGKCPDHDSAPEQMTEECWVLKMTERQKELVGKITSDEIKIRPQKYKKEILSFLENRLDDVSISRKNVSWGIPLPFDPGQTSYVWIDAFLNYLTGLGWNGDLDDIPDEWPADVQLMGKDIIRVHATIWLVMLMHLDMELPKEIFVHGHILSGGKKMSKTLGNAIAIEEMIGKFGTDGTRYLLLSAGPFGEDVDVTMERLVEKYNADLANGLGNLVSRVVKLSENLDILKTMDRQLESVEKENIRVFMDNLNFDAALIEIMGRIYKANKYITDKEPWKIAKENQAEFLAVMTISKIDLWEIAYLLEPFMPETSEKIKKALETKQAEILFPRIK
ncbi:MAG: methionine--tRNA ligase [Candidatus Moranbacteria bacterium]|nr:methionine--tRNA ligase [Candidatus Moranbacteria bacterium]